MDFRTRSPGRPEDLTAFARRAEGRGFSSLGTIDRITYGNQEPLVSLAMAAAVTERIGLATSVVLGPLRPNAASLGKQTLSLHSLSGGRLTLGLGLGGRDDDYAAAGISMAERGRLMDELLERITEVWDDETIGPNDHGRPKLLIGGAVDAAFRRTAQFGDGWIAGGAPPEQFAQAAEQVRRAWSEAGRDGEPMLRGLAYFSLGEKAEENAHGYLRDYYAFLGEETAGYIAGSAAKDAETVQGYLQAFDEVGCQELILFPSSSEAEQVDLLADAAGL